MQVKAHVTGSPRASNRTGRVELPIMVEGCRTVEVRNGCIDGGEDPPPDGQYQLCDSVVIVYIARSRVARLVRQLQEADRSAQHIKRLRNQ